MKSLGGGNKAIDTIKSPHKRETFYEIRNIAHKKENKENIKERLFRQPLAESRGGRCIAWLNINSLCVYLPPPPTGTPPS